MSEIRRYLKIFLLVAFLFFIFGFPNISTFAANSTPIAQQISFGPDHVASAKASQIYSFNWSGYAANSTVDSVTLVKASWIQPAIVCNSTANALQCTVFWVGMDGAQDSTVEQTGTYGYCAKGSSTPQYAAWYEFYPAQSIITVPMTVTPGDIFRGVVSFSSVTGKVTVSLKDMNSTAHFSKTNPNGFIFDRSSGECITETPTVSGKFALLANFGTMEWGKDYTMLKRTCSVTINGVSKPIGDYGSDTWQIYLCSYPSCDTIMAQPSSISQDGTSFTLAWENQGP